MGLEGDTEGDQQKRLLDLGFTYPDVPVTARCPYFQSTAGFNIGVFLNRGLMKETSIPSSKDGIRVLLGISPRGLWCTGQKHNRQKTDSFPPNFNKSTGIIQNSSYFGKQGSLKGYAPFSTLFDVKLLNLVKSATRQTDLGASDNELIRELHSKDLCVEHTEEDPLDKALAFQQSQMSEPRLTRFIPVEVHHYKATPVPDGTQMDYACSTVPAFPVAATNFDEEVWLAAKEFQDANPTTFISRVQIIYAIMVFIFMNVQGNRVALRADAGSGDQSHDSEMKLEVFVAYFPAYLRLHEIRRLGAYVDPFHMIQSLYAREAMVPGFGVSAPAQDSKWAKVTQNQGLISVAESPFAFLTPAMMEGSALGGPYLQFGSLSLSNVHQLMGLGSIWTIGLPEPVSAKQTTFGLYAFPAHWAPELPGKAETVYVKAETETKGLGFHIDVDLVPESWQTFTGLTSVELCDGQAEEGRVTGKVIVRHTGAKRGVRKLSENPRWTSHLPASDGILCRHHKKHKILNPSINIAELAKSARTAKSIDFINSLGTPENLKVGSPILLRELEDDASLTWPDAAAGGIQPIKVKPPGELSSWGQKKVSPKNISSRSGQPNQESADAVQKLRVLTRKYRSMKKSLEQEIGQKDAEIARLEQLSEDRLKEIAELSAQLKERGEIDGILHSRGEAVPTDAAIRERRLREELKKTNVDLRLSRQSEATAKAQASRSKTRILELEAKVSQIPEDNSTDLELLRANATREMADLKKAREELKGASLTLFELRKASLTEIELDEMTRRYGEKGKECAGLKDEIDRLRALLTAYDEDWNLTPDSEPEDPLPAVVPLHAMDRVQRKRTADEALFAVNPAAPGTKRLKLSTEINIGPYVSSSTGDFYSIAHNMVFREAASGGLINPLHFEVGQHGLVGITELARQRLELARTMSGVPYDKWKAEKEAELTQRIRGFMSKMGFFEYGHRSMIGLGLRLKDPNPVSSGFLVENLEAIIQQTDRDRRDLSSIRIQVRDEISPRSRHTTENAQWLNMAMEEMTLLLTSLFSRYGDEQLSTGLRTALGLGDCEYTVSEAKEICDKYDELIKEYHHLKADSKVPDCYLSALHHLPPE